MADLTFSADLLSDPSVWAAFLTLLVLEIVLGIDNVIFVSITASRLPERQRRPARLIGLGLALIMRLLLLFSIAWIVSLTEPMATIQPSVCGARRRSIHCSCRDWFTVSK